MALFLEEELLVACDTLREVIGLLIWSVERHDHHRMDASQGCTHRLGLGAQQVDIAVEHCLVVCGSGSIDNHLAGFIVLWLILLHNLCPKHACSAEFSQLHEVVLADAHIELDFAGSKVGIHTCIGEQLHIFIAPSQCIAKFLNDVCTCIVECVGINGNATELRIILENLHQFCSLADDSRHIPALHEEFLNGVEVDAAHQQILVVAFFLKVSDKDFSQFHCVALAGVEIDFNAFALNTFQQSGDELSAHLVARDAESERVNPFVEDVQRLCIGSGSIVGHDVLADIPLIGVLFVAAYEWEFAGQCFRCLQLQHIFSAIEGLHIETFVCSPNESFVEISPLEVDLDFIQPFLCGRSLKLAEEFFLVV